MRKKLYIFCLFTLCSRHVQGNGNSTCAVISHCKGNLCAEDGCKNGCEDGYFGRYCSNPCEPGCQGNKCNSKGGCTGDCVPGKWGRTCSLTCLKRCKTCDKNNGTLCLSCNDFEYGAQCERACRKRCPRSGCDMTGKCNTIDTCTGSDCGRCGIGCKHCVNNVCASCHADYKGADCSIYCINCLNCTDTGCTGCKKGYFGDQCQSRCSGNCEAEACDQISADCLHGCKQDYYGASCNVRCNEHCKGGACDRFNGKCSDGCADGYYGPYCLSYCSNCQDNKCNDVSGECLIGCQKGFYGKLCKNLCSPSCESGYCTRFDGTCYWPFEVTTTGVNLSDVETYSIVGGLFGSLLLMGIVCLLLIRRRRGKINRQGNNSRLLMARSERRKREPPDIEIPSLPTRARDNSELYEEVMSQDLQADENEVMPSVPVGEPNLAQAQESDVRAKTQILAITHQSLDDVITHDIRFVGISKACYSRNAAQSMIQGGEMQIYDASRKYLFPTSPM